MVEDLHLDPLVEQHDNGGSTATSSGEQGFNSQISTVELTVNSKY